MIDLFQAWAACQSGKTVDGQVVDHCELTVSTIYDEPVYYLRQVFKSMPVPADMDYDRELVRVYGPLTLPELLEILQ